MSLSWWVPPIAIHTIVSCLLWYAVSSLTSQATKIILVEYSYPLFLSQFQFLMGSILSLGFILVTRWNPNIANYFPLGSVPNSNDKPIFSVGTFMKILPLGLFQFVGKYCSLSATSLTSLAAVSSVKALSPLLIVLGYRVTYHVKFPAVTYLSLIPLVGGVIMIITEETPATNGKLFTNSNNEIDYKQIKGLLFCFVSTFIFAAQNIYGKKLITWGAEGSTPGSLALHSSSDQGAKSSKYVRQRSNTARLPYSTSDLNLDEMKQHQPTNDYTREVESNLRTLNNPLGSFVPPSEILDKPDRMSIIFYCSIIGFTISLTGFTLNELPHLLDLLSGNFEDSTPDTRSGITVVLGLIVINSLSHFLQTLLAFHLLGAIPAVSYSIASMMKRIVLIAISIVLAVGNEKDPQKYFGKITGNQMLGLILIAIGLYCYDRWGSRATKR